MFGHDWILHTCDPAGPVALSTVAAVAAHDKDVNALAFSPNDSLLATASQDKTIKLWSLPSLVQVATLRGHKRGVWDIAFSPAEQVGLGQKGQGLVCVWRLGGGDEGLRVGGKGGWCRWTHWEGMRGACGTVRSVPQNRWAWGKGVRVVEKIEGEWFKRCRRPRGIVMKAAFGTCP